MNSFRPNRRQFAVASVAGCLGLPASSAVPPKDDSDKARTTFRFVSKALDCIDDVAFSANRGTLALLHGGADSITVWDARTGQWRNTLALEFRAEYLFAVAADGQTVFGWGGATACTAWDVKTGRSRIVFERPLDAKAGDSTGAVAPDGARLATVHDGGGCPTLIRTRDATTGKPSWEFNNANGEQIIHCLAYSRDGAMLAAGTQDGKVKLLDSVTGKVGKVLCGESESVVAVSWSADGTRLAATHRRRKDQPAHVAVWDVGTRHLLGTIESPKGDATEAALTADGRLAAVVTEPNAISVWDIDARRVGQSEGREPPRPCVECRRPIVTRRARVFR